MADIKTPEERSRNMSHIRRTDTHPEVIFRKWLFEKGFRYSLGSRKVEGHPDLWMPKYNLAVFVQGCFWHRHIGCRYAYVPKSNIDYWIPKFDKNVKRDAQVKETLLAQGIRYFAIWECTIRKMEKDDAVREEVINQFILFLKSSENYGEL